MEHLDTGTLDNWYANRAQPLPMLVHRLAVIAPDDAPGLFALRQRLAQRAPLSLNCDHFAAGFKDADSASLASAFEQIRQRHATDPYDIVLLLEGRPEALGIAESNGLIPEQVSRMPVPVWTAIGEDDANTELGDVANRVFPNPAALIDALPLQAAVRQAGVAAPAPEAMHQPAAAPVLSLVTTSSDAAPAQPSTLPTLPSRQAAPAPARTSAHPLVLCAAGAVIVASMTAVAAMLGWLPSRVQLNAGTPERPVTTVRSLPSAPTALYRLHRLLWRQPAASTPEPLPDVAPSPSTPSTPQSSGVGENAALAAAGAAGAAGLMAAAPRARTTPPAPAKRPRRSSRRQAETASAQAQGQAPRQVGSTEVPVVEFVGTKSRQQVIAEMMEARRAANRQAANGNYFPSLGGSAARR